MSGSGPSGVYRSSATAPVGLADRRPVGPLFTCPACGEEGRCSGVDMITGQKTKPRGPCAAQVCKSSACNDGAALHLHQECFTCGHSWSVLPVGVKKDEGPEQTDATVPARLSASFGARAVSQAMVAGAVILIAKLLGWL